MIVSFSLSKNIYGFFNNQSMRFKNFVNLLFVLATMQYTFINLGVKFSNLILGLKQEQPK